MKILIISDAWTPQINGVVRTLEKTAEELTKAGHQILIAGPERSGVFTLAAPFYPEIRLEFFAHRRLARLIRDFAPALIHIATEGPLGWAARGVCMREGRAFTTSYHTRFPEYLAARAPRLLAPLVARIAYTVLRRFHAPAGAVMVSTDSIARDLQARKFHRLARWSRGVDMALFRPYAEPFAAYDHLPKPILLYVGRVAVEKNIAAFLQMEIAGTKIVVGDGPDLPALQAQYTNAVFLGALEGEKLARAYAAADLFVFPSMTDTFGLVLLEACASGLRVAACPAPGPSDIFAAEEARAFTAINADLNEAVRRALTLPQNPDIARAYAARFSWESCTRQFIANLQMPSPKARRWLARWHKKIGEGI